MTRRPVVAAALAVVLLGAGGCGGDDDSSSGEVDEDLVRELEAVPVTLYLPELRDTRPRKVEVDAGTVRVDLDGEPSWTLVLRPAPDVPDARLCAELGWAVAEGYDCTAADGVVRSTFEEMSSAAVVRGDTLLEADGLVTEVDTDLLDDAVAALQDAPEVSAEDLARE